MREYQINTVCKKKKKKKKSLILAAVLEQELKNGTIFQKAWPKQIGH
jgi:hypothetical protein